MDDDLFEEDKRIKEAEKVKNQSPKIELKKLEILENENANLNRLLMEKTKVVKVIELEYDSDDEVDDDDILENLRRKLKSNGIETSKLNIKVDSTVHEKEIVNDKDLNQLKIGDISQYIEAEGEDNDLSLFEIN